MSARLIWSLWSNLAGMGAIALVISWGIVQQFATAGPIVKGGPVTVLTPKVPVAGTLSFALEFERFESCPGVVIESYYSLDGPSAAVVSRRPTLSFAAKAYPPTRVNVQLPPQVTPGHWRYSQVVESRDCPSGHQGPDPFTEFEFEVTP